MNLKIPDNKVYLALGRKIPSRWKMRTSAIKPVVVFDATVNKPLGWDIVPEGGWQGIIYASFSTGVQQIKLTKLTLLWKRDNKAAGTVNISIAINDDNKPGDKLETLASANIGMLPVGQQWIVIRLNGTHVLSANTRYWLEITGTGAPGSIAYSRHHEGVGALTEFYKNAYGLHPNRATGPYVLRLEGV